MTMDAQRLEMIRANADSAGGIPGVMFPPGDMAFPFAKIAKQFLDGLEAGESILSFYNIALNYVAAGKLSQREGGEAS